MKSERRYSPIQGFDFRALEDSEFQEDSVREEIITPILRGLGYSATGPARIIRSRRLQHPFVSIGSARKRIELVPDYVFEVESRLAWLLEAKSPREEIRRTCHVEQAYSYAIHSEVRVPYFALCNGRELVVYQVDKQEPILDFPLVALPAYWDNLKAILHPSKVLAADLNLKKDFGLHLKRLGFHSFSSLFFPNVPIAFIGKIGDDHFMFGSGMRPDDGDAYAVTFDFNLQALQQLRGKVPDAALSKLVEPLRDDELRMVQFADTLYFATVDCRVGDELSENDKEIFLPLIVNRFI